MYGKSEKQRQKQDRKSLGFFSSFPSFLPPALRKHLSSVALRVPACRQAGSEFSVFLFSPGSGILAGGVFFLYFISLDLRARSSGVEHLPFKQRVDGSKPSALTRIEDGKLRIED